MSIFGYWVAYSARPEIVVALDWKLRARRAREVVLSMLTGHGRATPLMWRMQASTLKGNQRRYEDELLRALRQCRRG